MSSNAIDSNDRQWPNCSALPSISDHLSADLQDPSPWFTRAPEAVAQVRILPGALQNRRSQVRQSRGVRRQSAFSPQEPQITFATPSGSTGASATAGCSATKCATPAEDWPGDPLWAKRNPQILRQSARPPGGNSACVRVVILRPEAARQGYPAVAINDASCGSGHALVGGKREEVDELVREGDFLEHVTSGCVVGPEGAEFLVEHPRHDCAGHGSAVAEHDVVV
jgi:hypothetical protein